MLTNERQRVRKGRQGFGIPGRLTGRKGLLSQPLMSKKGDKRKESQESRRGAQHGQIRPLALGLDAQRGAHLMKGHVTRPTHDKPCQDLNRVGRWVRPPHGLRGTCALWVTDEDPANGNRWNARMVPQSRARCQLDWSGDASLPGNGTRLPDRCGIGQSFGEGGLTLAFDRRPTFLACFS